MAKIAPTSIKYIVHAKFTADVPIEKPDVIGAIFGQTEGLLGEDMEMRELQKQGKIGRIDVELSSEDGSTVGEIEIPSAMDKTETTLIGAALETIEKIGPSETKITVEKIEDVRGSKRDYIMERARQLLAGIQGGDDFKDLGKELGASSKAAALQTYGTENLPCGDISGNEVIVVEGRADVVNMLRQGISNVICMNGVKLPETIKELSREKSVTLFVDGDRGGKLIIRNVTENAKVDYIAVAPEGKEVEELTSKEILQALRKKVPVEEYFSREERGERDSRENRRDRFSRNDRGRGMNREGRSYGYSNDRRGYGERRGYNRYSEEGMEKGESESSETTSENSSEMKASEAPRKKLGKLTAKETEKIKETMQEMAGVKVAVFFNKNLEIIKKLPISRIGNFESSEDIYALAINDTALPNIIRGAERLGVSNLAATNFTITDTDINLVSL